MATKQKKKQKVDFGAIHKVIDAKIAEAIVAAEGMVKEFKAQRDELNLLKGERERDRKYAVREIDKLTDRTYELKQGIELLARLNLDNLLKRSAIKKDRNRWRTVARVCLFGYGAMFGLECIIIWSMW